MIDAPAPVASSPSPVASACPPNAPAHVVKLVRPAYDAYMRRNASEGLVDILVTLRADGSIGSAVVARSTGDAYLDGAAYDAAIATTYAAEIRDCATIAGKYVYRTHYSSGSPATAAPVPSSGPSPSPSPARASPGP